MLSFDSFSQSKKDIIASRAGCCPLLYYRFSQRTSSIRCIIVLSRNIIGVVSYDATSIAQILEDDYNTNSGAEELHTTPTGGSANRIRGEYGDRQCLERNAIPNPTTPIIAAHLYPYSFMQNNDIQIKEKNRGKHLVHIRD
jgi:hypothetical protein